MFEHWYALDAGSHSVRLYDYSKKKSVELRTCIAQDNQNIIATGRNAFEYIYGDQRKVQVKYPLDHGQINGDISCLIKEAFHQINDRQNAFRPALMVALPTELSESHKQLWQVALSKAGVKKMEWVSNMEILLTENPCFLIHAGHSYCEFGIYANDKTFVEKTIHFAGKQIDEAIQMIVTQKTRCLVSNEDACSLKEAASKAFWDKKNPVLSCMGLDRFQKYVRIEIHAMDLWKAFEPTLKQIVLWAKQCFSSLSMEMKETVLLNGILLSGGLASCFGLKQMLEQTIQCPVICTNEPKYDMIDAMKEWK